MKNNNNSLLLTLKTALVAVLSAVAVFVVAPGAAFAQLGQRSQTFAVAAYPTTGVAISLADLGNESIITNTGATGAVVLTLPDCDSSVFLGGSTRTGRASTVGLVVRVNNTVAQTLALDPGVDTNTGLATTDTISGIGTVPSTAIALAGGNKVIGPATIGAQIVIMCVADDKWQILDASGAWTDGGA